jgi:hypothetical protein
MYSTYYVRASVKVNVLKCLEKLRVCVASLFLWKLEAFFVKQHKYAPSSTMKLYCTHARIIWTLLLAVPANKVVVNMLPVPVKMLEDGRKLICKVREILRHERILYV